MKYLNTILLCAILFVTSASYVKNSNNGSSANNCSDLSIITERLDAMEENSKPFVETEFYKEHLIDVSTIEQLKEYSGKKATVFLFVMDGCTYCEQEEKVIRKYVGDDWQFDLYFVDVNKNNEWWSVPENYNDGDALEQDLTNFYVSGTPTYLVYDGTTYSKYVGAGNFITIYDLLTN